MNCPKCHATMRHKAAVCDECGWKPKEQAATGPDYARMAADRERSMKRTFEVYTGPRACQERTCPKRAVPGLDFCDKHAVLPESEVRRIGRPNFKTIGELL